LGIVIVRLGQASGVERRRMSWVVAGSVVSAVGETFTNFEILGVLPQAPQWATTLSAGTQIALPIAFAYAILRHRVVDLGFAINRTVVYATITATLVIGVGAVDWLSGKLLSNAHISAVVEAAATIALGAALGWLHRRIERGVDRILFRSRYVAERRIDGRIAALEYATTTDSIDATLVGETSQILALAWAAVFRRTDDAWFERTAAYGWDASAARISLDHVLIRTLPPANARSISRTTRSPTTAFPRAVRGRASRSPSSCGTTFLASRCTDIAPKTKGSIPKTWRNSNAWSPPRPRRTTRWMPPNGAAARSPCNRFASSVRFKKRVWLSVYARELRARVPRIFERNARGAAGKHARRSLGLLREAFRTYLYRDAANLDHEPGHAKSVIAIRAIAATGHLIPLHKASPDVLPN